MAGGVLKTLGVLALVAGILALVGGLAAAGYAYMDQQEHEDDAGPLGAGEDPDRTEMNEALLAGGAIAAGVGFVGIVSGIILLVAGGVRAERGLRRQTQVVQAGMPGDQGHAIRGSPGSPLHAGEHADAPGRPLVAVGVVAAVLLVGVLAMAAVGTGPLGGASLLQGPPPALIGDESFDGRTEAGLAIQGVDPARSAFERITLTPGATERLTLALDWTPATGGPARYAVTLAADGEDGWVELTTVEVAPADVVDVAGDGATDLGGRDLRIVVRPAAANGVHAAQSFEATLSFYRR